MSNRLNRRVFLHGALLATATISGADLVIAKDPRRDRLVARQSQLPVPVRSMTLHNESGAPVPISAVARNPSTGEIVVAGDDEAIRLVNPQSLQVTRTIGSHRDRIRTLAFDPSGKLLVSAGNDGQLIVWNATNHYAVKQRMGGTPALARVCFAPRVDDALTMEIAAVGFGNEIFLISESRRKQSRPSKLTCQCRDLRAVTYRDDGEVIAVAGRSGDLHLFDANSGRMLHDKPLHRGRINDAVFAKQSNLLITVGDDGYLCVFDTGGVEMVRREKITTGKLFSITMLTSQLVAVAGSDNDIRIVNVDEGIVAGTLQGHRGSIPSLVAGDGYLFSGGFDATLRRWSIDNLNPEEQRIAENASSEKK